MISGDFWLGFPAVSNRKCPSHVNTVSRSSMQTILKAVGGLIRQWKKKKVTFFLFLEVLNGYMDMDM